MIEKNAQEAKIRKGSPKRNSVCYQTLQDIVIPAGTILRHDEEDKFRCSVGVVGAFSITLPPGISVPGLYRRIVAA